MASVAVCAGAITVKASGALDCSTVWQALPLDMLGMLFFGDFDPELFGVVLGGVILVWAIGFGVGMVSGTMRRAR
jgi:hypothetical protein